MLVPESVRSYCHDARDMASLQLRWVGDYFTQHRGVRLGTEIGAMVLASTLAAWPFAEVVATTQAVVVDDAGPLPARISTVPDRSSITFGPLGALNNTSERFVKHGVGVNVAYAVPEKTAIKLIRGDFRDISTRAISTFDKPEPVFKAYEHTLSTKVEDIKDKTQWELGAVLFAALLAASYANRKQPLRSRYARTSATALGLSLVSFATGYELHQTWAQEQATPVQQVAIQGLKGTAFEGTTADNQLIAGIVERAKPIFNEQNAKIDRANEAFRHAAHASIDSLLASDSFVPPGEDETTVLTLADLHSNEDMIDAYTYFVSSVRNAYGDNVADRIILLLVGDESYGSSAEIPQINKMSRIATKNYFVWGNHTSKITAQALVAAGFTPLDGKTIETATSLSLLSGIDPELSKFGSLFGISSTVSRSGDNMTEAQLGESLLEEAKRTRPTIIAPHEAYAAGPLIGVDVTGQSSMDQYFTSSVSAGQPSPASLVAYGHWHRTFQYKIVPKVGGGYGIVSELGSAGGVPGGDSAGGKISYWGLPPYAIASAAMFTFDNASQEPVRIQEMATTTSGVVTMKQHSLPQSVVSAAEHLVHATKNGRENNKVARATK